MGSCGALVEETVALGTGLAEKVVVAAAQRGRVHFLHFPQYFGPLL